MKAAIMGYGTIGSGVYEVLDKNCKSVEKKAGEPIEVKYILDLREFPGSPDGIELRARAFCQVPRTNHRRRIRESPLKISAKS